MNTCIFSEDRAHRYTLLHRWDELITLRRRVMWIGLNPSTADEQALDPTLRRIRSFSVAWGCNEFVMTNLFAFRATQPRDMKKAADPVGRLNDSYLLEHANASELIVACWGADGDFKLRSEEVLSLLAYRPLHCLGMTRSGMPRHPLYLPGNTDLEVYQPAAA